MCQVSRVHYQNRACTAVAQQLAAGRPPTESYERKTTYQRLLILSSAKNHTPPAERSIHLSTVDADARRPAMMSIVQQPRFFTGATVAGESTCQARVEMHRHGSLAFESLGAHRARVFLHAPPSSVHVICRPLCRGEAGCTPLSNPLIPLD